MEVKKILLIIALSLAIIFLGVKIYGFWSQEKTLNAQLAGAEAALTKAQTEEADSAQDAQYLANPVNLEKELRSRFNYKKPGETMVVIVPGAATSTASDTQE